MKIMSDKNIKNITKKLIMLFFVAVLLDVLVFNIRFFQSSSYEEIPFGASHTLSVEGGIVNEDGTIMLDEDSAAIKLHVGKIDGHLENVRIDVEGIDKATSYDYYNEIGVYDVKVSVQDEALHEKMNDNGETQLENGIYDLTEKKVLHSVPDSQYIWLETFGKTSDIEILITPQPDDTRSLKINDLTFNATKPFKLSPYRISVSFFILSIIYIFLFEKSIWNEDCITYKRWKVILPIIVLCLSAVFIFTWDSLNMMLKDPAFDEYATLARALAGKNVSLGNASNIVKELEGSTVFWRMGSNEVMFDHAMYNGKYYVYFGILPCLIFFLPYYLVTGKDMINSVPVAILCLTIVSELYILMGMIIRRYYRKTPYAARWLMTLAMICGMYLPLYMSIPDHYMIAIASGVALTLAGGMCWMHAWKNDGKVMIRFLALGACLFAAVSLCRPTLLLMGIAWFMVMIYLKRAEIAKLKKSEFIKSMFAIAIPYAAFASICMYYNYIRFDSPFDFGADKNMTTIPFTSGSPYLPYMIARTLYEYLFSIPKYTSGFPFIIYEDWKQLFESASALAVIKPTGGIFITSPVLWCMLLCIAYRKRIHEKKLSVLMLATLATGMFLMIYAVVFTGNAADRYMMEFSFILFICAFTGIMEFYADAKEKLPEKTLNMIMSVVICLLLISVFYGILQLFTGKTGYGMKFGNPDLYYSIYYDMNFML